MIVKGVQQLPSTTPFSVSMPGVWTLHVAAAKALEASVKDEKKRLMRILNEWKTAHGLRTYERRDKYEYAAEKCKTININ
jgi:hypothetical protein